MTHYEVGVYRLGLTASDLYFLWGKITYKTISYKYQLKKLISNKKIDIHTSKQTNKNKHDKPIQIINCSY